MNVHDPRGTRWHHGVNLLLPPDDAAVGAELAPPRGACPAEPPRRRRDRPQALGREPGQGGEAFEAFDAERVARIREAVAEGRFRVNADVVAAGLLAGIRKTVSHCERCR